MKWIRSAWGGLRTVLAGAAVGVANVIPGVSGGTMAVILGVFDRMVEALGLKNLRKNIGFLILFGLGAGGGVLAFSGLIKWLLEHYPTATAAVFFGLVLGSIPMIFRRAGGRAFRPAELMPLCGGIAVMVGFMLLQNHAGAGDTAGAQALTLPLALTLFAVCAVSTVAMILPGISGSAMLVIFGQYYTVIGAISAVADVLRGQLTLAQAWPRLLILLPAGLGIACGLVFGSRLVHGLLQKYPHGTYAAILGLILGSLAYLFPSFGLNAESAVAAVLLIGSAALSAFFTLKEK